MFIVQKGLLFFNSKTSSQTIALLTSAVRRTQQCYEENLLLLSCFYCHGSEQQVFLNLPLIVQLLETASDSSPHSNTRQNLDILDPYIAAKLDSLPAIFTLGDEKKYNQYSNRALPSQQQYVCFILAELVDHESVS